MHFIYLIMNKRGQIHLSFGMIFSIILIVVFLVLAFFVIKRFLGLQQDVIYRNFIENFQSDVESVYKSTSASSQVNYSMPNKVDRVCFVKNCKSDFRCNDIEDNLVFEGEKQFESAFINYIDLDKTIGDSINKEFCVNVINKKLRLGITKDYQEALVTINPISS